MPNKGGVSPPITTPSDRDEKWKMLKRSGWDSVLVYDPDQDNCRTIQLFGGREVTQHAQGDLTLTVSVGDPDPHSL